MYYLSTPDGSVWWKCISPKSHSKNTPVSYVQKIFETVSLVFERVKDFKNYNTTKANMVFSVKGDTNLSIASICKNEKTRLMKEMKAKQQVKTCQMRCTGEDEGSAKTMQQTEQRANKRAFHSRYNQRKGYIVPSVWTEPLLKDAWYLGPRYLSVPAEVETDTTSSCHFKSTWTQYECKSLTVSNLVTADGKLGHNHLLLLVKYHVGLKKISNEVLFAWEDFRRSRLSS